MKAGNHRPEVRLKGIAAAPGVARGPAYPLMRGMAIVSCEKVVDPEAEIIFGTAVDDSLNDEVRITVIGTGFTGRQVTMRSVLDGLSMEPKPIRMADLQPEPGMDNLNEADLPTFLRRTFPAR